MATTRRHFDADQKAAILKRYLVEKVPISDLCDEYGLQPNQIYQWQGVLFDNAAVVLERAGRRGKPATVAERRVAHLEELLQRKEAKLQQKNEVIAELMEDNVRAKKACGLRQEALERRKRCKEANWKPFVGTLWVPNPTRQSLASSRK